MGKTVPNARAAESDVAKDNAKPEEVKAADAAATNQSLETPADNPQEPPTVTEESASETVDRHLASTELPVGEVTPEETQEGPMEPEDVLDLIVPGAATGPDVAGTIRNDLGKVAWAPPGSQNAAFNGVQQDASGHVDSVGTDNSSKSGTRI